MTLRSARPLGLMVLAVTLAFAVVATGCTADGRPAENGANDNVQRLWVGAEEVECIGAFPQTCLLVATSADGEYGFFYSTISGFAHESGTSYVLDVEVTEVAEPLQDASSLSYRLLNVVEANS